MFRDPADAALLPRAWEERLVRVANVNTGGGAGLCLEAHDLAVSKLAAGREKDLEFVRAMARRGLVSVPTLRERLTETPLRAEVRELCEGRLRTLG